MTDVTHGVAQRRGGAANAIRSVNVIEGAGVSTEILASAIVNIADGVKKLRDGPLNDRALFVLIQDACPRTIGLDKIRMVFDAIGDLRKKFVRS
jgi:hypothetical protein